MPARVRSNFTTVSMRTRHLYNAAFVRMLQILNLLIICQLCTCHSSWQVVPRVLEISCFDWIWWKDLHNRMMMGSKKNERYSSNYDYSFKVLLVGDSGVGKSSLLLGFITNCQQFPHHLSPTIGVDFKIKLLTTGGKRLKLTIWDTAGQERFGILASSYYRGAHGIILVYDMTRRETFTNLSKIWAKELEHYCTNTDCIKILVGNKLDRDSERAVAMEEGMAFAEKHKCLFHECSAKTQENVKECFKELTVKG